MRSLYEQTSFETMLISAKRTKRAREGSARTRFGRVERARLLRHRQSFSSFGVSPPTTHEEEGNKGRMGARREGRGKKSKVNSCRAHFPLPSLSQLPPPIFPSLHTSMRLRLVSLPLRSSSSYSYFEPTSQQRKRRASFEFESTTRLRSPCPLSRSTSRTSIEGEGTKEGEISNNRF